MKLQDIFSQDQIKKSYYEIELDENSTKPEFMFPPSGLEEIGVMMKLDDDGNIHEDLIDLIFSYKTENVSVVVEVPSDWISSGKITVKNMISLANSLNFHTAFLPPGHPKVDINYTMDQYKDLVAILTDELLAKPLFDKLVFPFSAFMEYLALERILPPDVLIDFKPEDSFIKLSFFEVLKKNEADEFKKIIRDKLYVHYNGEEGFNIMMNNLIFFISQQCQDSYQLFLNDVMKTSLDNACQKILKPV